MPDPDPAPVPPPVIPAEPVLPPLIPQAGPVIPVGTIIYPDTVMSEAPHVQ